MLYQTTISDHALEEMVLAASESFVLGNSTWHGSVEIHGYLWGNRRVDSGGSVEYVHIDKFSISASASGDEDSVQVDDDVVRLKNSILNFWAPHYHFLGTFHTHPYDTLDEVKEHQGWNFSRQDRSVFLRDEDLWKLSGPNHYPIMMVMAVTQIAKVNDTELSVHANGGRIEFNVGNLRFWLSMGIGRMSEGMDKEFSTEDVLFHPFTRHVNLAGSKLDGINT